MYKVPTYVKTTLDINESIEGETIENKVERIVNNQEGLDDGSPSIYTERKDGVLDAYNIRADKWDLAIDAMGLAHNQDLQKRMKGISDREEALKELNNKEKGLSEEGKNEGKNEPGGESIA